MSSENRTSKNRELEECLQDSESRNNLLGFFETLVEIARENPELFKDELSKARNNKKRLND